MIDVFYDQSTEKFIQIYTIPAIELYRLCHPMTNEHIRHVSDDDINKQMTWRCNKKLCSHHRFPNYMSHYRMICKCSGMKSQEPQFQHHKQNWMKHKIIQTMITSQLKIYLFDKLAPENIPMPGKISKHQTPFSMTSMGGGMGLIIMK